MDIKAYLALILLLSSSGTFASSEPKSEVSIWQDFVNTRNIHQFCEAYLDYGKVCNEIAPDVEYRLYEVIINNDQVQTLIFLSDNIFRKEKGSYMDFDTCRSFWKDISTSTPEESISILTRYLAANGYTFDTDDYSDEDIKSRHEQLKQAKTCSIEVNGMILGYVNKIETNIIKDFFVSIDRFIASVSDFINFYSNNHGITFTKYDLIQMVKIICYSVIAIVAAQVILHGVSRFTLEDFAPLYRIICGCMLTIHSVNIRQRRWFMAASAILLLLAGLHSETTTLACTCRERSSIRQSRSMDDERQIVNFKGEQSTHMFPISDNDDGKHTSDPPDFEIWKTGSFHPVYSGPWSTGLEDIDDQPKDSPREVNS